MWQYLTQVKIMGVKDTIFPKEEGEEVSGNFESVVFPKANQVVRPHLKQVQERPFQQY